MNVCLGNEVFLPREFTQYCISKSLDVFDSFIHSKRSPLLPVIEMVSFIKFTAYGSAQDGVILFLF